MGIWTEKAGWIYRFVIGELTWGTVCVYGSILLLSWLFCKLVIFPHLSPLKKIPGRPEQFRHILFGHLPEILRREAIDPYQEWVAEMKTGIIRYRHFLGSYRVLVADAEAFKDIFVTTAKYCPRPSIVYRAFERIAGKTSLLSLEGQEHNVQRRLCSTAFKTSSLECLLPTFQRKAELLSSLWVSAVDSQEDGTVNSQQNGAVNSQQNGAVNSQQNGAVSTEQDGAVGTPGDGTAVVAVDSSSSNLTFDIICEAGFGYQTNSLVDSLAKIAVAFRNVISPGGSRLLRIVIPKIIRLLPLESNKRFESGRRFLRSLVKEVINEKKTTMTETAGEEKSSMDLLGMLVSATDAETGVGLSEVQLQDHVMTFMIAGHETSASALCWILLTLANHPDIQTKARQEAMSCLPPSGQPITYEVLDQMPYINCIVKETLRLYPPVPIVMRVATKDMVLGGYEIPKDTLFSLSIGALHRNPAYWKDPNEFRPERFLDESAIPFYAYQPFISGPHMCIGYKFALLELRLVLAVLFKQLEFFPLPGVAYEKRQSITMRPSPPLKLKIRRVV